MELLIAIVPVLFWVIIFRIPAVDKVLKKDVTKSSFWNAGKPSPQKDES
jgi:hypothetical protein